MKRQAIIVAGGNGTRMGLLLPKQFLNIGGKIILMRTIENIHTFDPTIEFILVLPSDQRDYWKNLCQTHQFSIPHTIANGGNTRFESVKNGLALAQEKALIAVHDGVRPFTSHDTLKRCFEMAEKKGNAIPVCEIFDSIRKVNGYDNSIVNRNELKAVQTPQVFKGEILFPAYKQPYSASFTDDASVVESLGININLVEGNRENIKITTAFDLKIAENLI